MYVPAQYAIRPLEAVFHVTQTAYANNQSLLEETNSMGIDLEKVQENTIRMLAL